MLSRPVSKLHSCDAGYQTFKDELIERTGLAYYRRRDDRLLEVLQKRLVATGATDLHDYRALLFGQGEESVEFSELVSRLTVGETYFFRCPEQVEALRDCIIPECIERRRADRVLRIWSAGCSTGAEAYSLAILLRRDFGAVLNDWRVRILATDINSHALLHAERARFDDWHLRTMTSAECAACFRRDGGHWWLRDEYRGLIDFELHNLAIDPFPSVQRLINDFDIILCRNVLIYFDKQVAARILDRFGRTLALGGWLLLGPTDPFHLAARRMHAAGPASAFAYRHETADDPSRAAADVRPVDPLDLLPSVEKVRSMGERWRVGDGSSKPARVSPLPPDTTETATTLADVRWLADRGCWERAGQACDALLETDAEDPEVQLMHGLILEHWGDTEGAEMAYTRAAYLDRHHALAWYHLGRMQAHNGRGRRAIKSFRAANAAIDESDTSEWSSEVPPARLRQMVEMQIEIRS